MRCLGPSLAFFVLPMAIACSGGGGGGGGVINDPANPSLTASFVPAQPSPAPETTAMAHRTAAGELVTIAVNVWDTDDVYGAGFDVTFDPARAQYVGSSHGDVLEAGGHSPTYHVGNASPGRIVVGVSRQGNVSAVHANGTLINLTFRVTDAGNNTLAFGSPELFDGQVPPQPIPNVSWFGGSIHAE